MLVGTVLFFLMNVAANAIACESKQFTTREFFGYDWLPSLVLMGLLALLVYFIRPMMGTPVLAPK